tara:strand:+ start:260 stop:550 length:291 start_codon:yes stop_codon:yes gene_type:complete
MAISKLEAIQSLHPTAQFVLRGDELTWQSDDITEPTEEEITAEQERLQAEYDSNEYQRNRAAEYPSVIDQLDDIYHNGIDGWKATIKETKDKYPKE